MPFAFIAISAPLRFPSVASDHGIEVETASVFEKVDDRIIRWLTRNSLTKGDELASSFYGGSSSGPTGLSRMRPVINVRRHIADGADMAVVETLRGFLWLIQALTSNEYTTVESRISRRLARSTNRPRVSWEIKIRAARSSVESAKHQFSEVFRKAHAVRGHFRTNFRTGTKSIRVRSHILGNGEAIQIRDYLVQ